MIVLQLFSGGDIARLAKAFKVSEANKKDVSELKNTWMNILKQQSANIYKLMKMSMELGENGINRPD